MKLKDFIKRLEGFNPDLEIELVDETNEYWQSDLDKNLRIYEDGKFCIVKICMDSFLSDKEYSDITNKAFDDGFVKYQNLNPFRKKSASWEAYEEYNNRGMVAADQ